MLIESEELYKRIQAKRQDMLENPYLSKKEKRLMDDVFISVGFVIAKCIESASNKVRYYNPFTERMESVELKPEKLDELRELNKED